MFIYTINYKIYVEISAIVFGMILILICFFKISMVIFFGSVVQHRLKVLFSIKEHINGIMIYLA